MSLMTTIMSHQCYQCALDWGRETQARMNSKDHQNEDKGLAASPGEISMQQATI